MGKYLNNVKKYANIASATENICIVFASTLSIDKVYILKVLGYENIVTKIN